MRGREKTSSARWYSGFKRAADVVTAGAALAVLSPVIGITAALVRKNLGSPVLFKQPRPGRNGRVFNLYKFRTMKNPDPDAGLVSDEDRLTPFGKMLRSTSLDELPSLWNVARGDMSIVGPRPLLVEYLGRYSPQQRRRHEVRPGLTGLAQVNGRNAQTWEERFRWDVEYVDRVGLALDAQILWQTIKVVLRREGVSATDHVTMPEFTGKVAGTSVTSDGLAQKGSHA